MSIATDVSRIKGNVTAALAAIADKGVTVPAGSTSDALAGLIASIEAGGGGGYEVSIGIITPTEDSTALSFEHGLSKAPDYVIVFLPYGYSYTTYCNSLRMYYKKYGYSTIDEKWDAYVTSSSASNLKHPNSMSSSQSAFDINETTVTANECTFGFSSNMKWMSGKPYLWICISGELVFPYK